MDGVVAIVTGRERRRRWSAQDKLRIVAETHEPGAMRGRCRGPAWHVREPGVHLGAARCAMAC